MNSTQRLPRATPESQGVASADILKWVEAVEENIHELHSFMLLRNGKVLAEGWWKPYLAEDPHMLFSLSKSFTSTAIGMTIQAGRLKLSDKVVSFFPDDLPAKISAHLPTMQIRHLLSMSTGHATDTTRALHEAQDGNWPKAFLSLPVENLPGTHFLYNTGATYMLSAILQKVTGEKLIDFLTPRLFNPLGIAGATWEEDPRGVNTGGYGLSVKTEDIACFGQLYLQKGEWNGQSLISEAWVEEATNQQIENDAGNNPNSDWTQGYGYQFWRCRHHAYRGDGAFGQYCLVMPDHNAVLAITAGVGDMQAPLDLVWNILDPVMKLGPLPENSTAHSALEQKLNDLNIQPPQGLESSGMRAKVSGKTYTLAPNELQVQTVRFDFTSSECDLIVCDRRGEHRLVLGSGEWKKGESSLFDRQEQAASAGAWTAEDTYTGVTRAILTPFFTTFECKFSGDELKVEMIGNVGFVPPTKQVLEGKI